MNNYIENPKPMATDQNTQASGDTQQYIYTFPSSGTPGIPTGSQRRQHVRSMSHGGATSAPAPTTRPSVLKGSRGHQRALSHGQVVQIVDNNIGHSRGSSRTNFDLPPSHRETETTIPKGHSRQASRSESIYTLRRSEVPSIWHRLFRKSLQSDDRGFRTVVPNHIVPPKTPKREHPNGNRVNNRVRTTKYTMLSFLPRNLLEQFHRVANLYFIFIVLLNWVPMINAFGKEIAMIPVMFVLGVTAVKDLFEDRRRHASDKRINNSTCRIYKGEEERYRKTLWKDCRVGDLIHLSNNEQVPADILLLRSSDPNGTCYLDTSHLDGEANLKLRQVPRGFVEKQDVFEPHKFRSVIEVDPPSTKIYRFHGTMAHPTGERVTIGTENLLLRECVLKNTDFVEGIILYAGHETKAMLNNGGPRYKRSKLERQMNLDVIWCVLILIVLCLIGAVGCYLWILPFANAEKFIPFLPNMMQPWLEGAFTFWTFIIILQIMIPLSLYVTLEFAKILQVYHIHNDSELHDTVKNKRIECRALNITEELGQIQYVFSDKTGTLTENKMIFRHCCLNGTDYSHQVLNDVITKNGIPPVLPNQNFQNEVQNLRKIDLTQVDVDSPHLNSTAKINEFLTLLAICNTVVVSKHPHCDLMNASGMIDDHSQKNNNYSRLAESRSITPSPPLNMDPCTSQLPVLPVPLDSPNVDKKRKQLLNLPSLLFANCKRVSSESSTVIAPERSPSEFVVAPIFEAESPDELALVNAACLYDYKLCKRGSQSVSILVGGLGIVEIDVLKILPFDATRKMMSVIIRHPFTRTITLYTKGADSAIFNRLLPIESRDTQTNNLIEKTQHKINSYAKIGLRVLVMAKRTLKESEYITWSNQHTECEKGVDDLSKERRVRESFQKIEQNLVLLGATGIEDRLQEGVPETLASLISAGIIVWVLTGDKPDTAINISYSAKLFDPEMDILKLMTRSKDTAERTIMFYLEEIEKLNSSTTHDSQDPRENFGEDVVQPTRRKRALVVDGKTLTYILDKRSNLTRPFLKLSLYCNSVLCCRATPLQKAYIVKVVKEELKMRTLAIGDGANDVSMIQTADVGIGISGQEGMQAVMAADFAMSRFVYLKRFLLVHGHWSYDRLARMILYFFYKNAAFVFLNFWYQLYCGFSGQVMIDEMYLMLYNFLFTSLPPLVIGVYDQDAPDDLLIKHPFLYKQGRLGLVYKPHSFWITMADALYQSIAIYFVAMAAFDDSDVGMWTFGTTIATSCMFTMVLHASIENHCWTAIHVISLIISVSVFFFFEFLYNSVEQSVLGLPTMYWIIQEAVVTKVYWLVILLSCVVALLPRLLIRMLQTTYWPNDVTQALLDRRKTLSRGEGFLVSWSRSSSASSIYRTGLRNKHYPVTA